MKIARLFHVLVVGGSLLAATSCSDDDSSQADGAAGAADSATPGPDGAGGGDGGAILNQCFCDTQHDTCCEGTEVRPGFECCWSTSC